MPSGARQEKDLKKLAYDMWPLYIGSFALYNDLSNPEKIVATDKLSLNTGDHINMFNCILQSH